MQITIFSSSHYALLFTLPWIQAVCIAPTLPTRPPTTTIRPVSTVVRLPTTTVRPPTTTVRPPTTTVRLPTTTARPMTTTMRPVTTIAGLVTTTARPPTATTTSAGAVVTNEAYIDTVLRHHNVHRANHSASALTWSPSLSETARQIAANCVFQHNMSVNGGGYGQNIGAGFPANMMGQFITGGLYNSEVNSYVYFGAEPDLSTLAQWGHFSQIVWKGTASVGCYTYDCSQTGLGNTGSYIPPYFTVCNYGPQGNIISQFAQNVGRSLGRASVDASYGCGTTANCVGSTS